MKVSRARQPASPVVENIVDLGGCEGATFVLDPARWLILLPGASYSTQAPLLWFAAEIGRARGWSVLEARTHWNGDGDALAWGPDLARRCLAAPFIAGPVLIGKSLASLAAGVAAEQSIPAVWLTPLLDEPAFVTALAKAASPTLLVGGDADACWRPEAIPRSPNIEATAVPDVDHGFSSSRGVSASIEAHDTAARAIDSFLARLDSR